jgi:hypothetical protein
MAVLKNCELWYTRIHPKYPNRKYDKENPTWEVQIRTTDPAQKKEWKALNLPVKDVIPPEGSPYSRVNLKKKIKKKDGTDASFVQVVDGKGNDVDPMTIHNGSVGNVRVFQYNYPKTGGGQGVASVLMGIQLTKHIVLKRKPREPDFEEVDTEVIVPEGEDDDDNEASSDASDVSKY